MIQIKNRLFIGNDSDCLRSNNSFAIIHACKTCHQKSIGYKGSLSASHPNYLVYQRGINLFLNLVDMEKELMPRFTHPIMAAAFHFINTNIQTKDILIHCNQGQSRSPSIGLVFLARIEAITNSSYIDAKSEFRLIYPSFNPGQGIERYMHRFWGDILAL